MTTTSVYDKNIAFEMIDSVRNYNYILMNAAYDSPKIYNYISENTYSMPIIEINKRSVIRSDRLTVNRMVGIEQRKEYLSMYSLR